MYNRAVERKGGDDMIDAVKIKELRGDRTQRVIAGEADITLATLNAIEKGRNTHPDLLTVGKLARVLGVPPGDLLKVE